MTLEPMPLPVALGTEHEPSPAASEHMPLHTCDGFKLTPVASEQVPSPSWNGFELSPGGAGTDAVTCSA